MIETKNGKITQKSPYGVMINGDWYNVSKGDTSGWLGTVEKDDIVTVEFESNEYQGKIYRNVKSISSNGSTGNNSGVKAEKKSYNEGARLGMIINNASAHVSRMAVQRIQSGAMQEFPAHIWAVSVAQHAKALMDEMKKQGLEE